MGEAMHCPSFHPTSTSLCLVNFRRTITLPIGCDIIDMSDQSESSPFQSLFDCALRGYEKQTGIGLANHPLAEQLQNCQSVESVITLLQEQARASQALSKSRESDKIFNSLKGVVSALSSISVTAAFGQAIGMVCPGPPIGCSTSLMPIQ